MAKAMFVRKGVEADTIEQDVTVEVVEQRDVTVEEGDLVTCLVRGKARPFAGGREVEILDASLIKIVKVEKPLGR